MKSHYLASFAIFLAIILFAGAFVIVGVPESKSVRSIDGAVTVTGLAKASQNIIVGVDESAKVGEPLLGLVYKVEPSGVMLDEPIVLSFKRDKILGTIDATTVYQWNSQLGMWVPLPSVVADTKDVLSVQVMTLGDFALGTSPKIIAPNLLTMRDELLKKAPADTLGFRIIESFTLPNGVPVQIPRADVVGGCGGQVGSMNKLSYSSISSIINVPVNDVQTAVTFGLVGEWGVSGNGKGCAISEPLKPQGTWYT